MKHGEAIKIIQDPREKRVERKAAEGSLPLYNKV